MRGLRRTPNSATRSVRQNQAHQRHYARRETDQKHCMLERQDSDRPQRVDGDDGGGKVVESFTIFFFGCYFHTLL
jgi:hypothetical protein